MIKGLHVQNFKGFKELELKDFQRINLFVGVNDTGKTSLMKLMYAVLKTINSAKNGKANSIFMKGFNMASLYFINNIEGVFSSDYYRTLDLISSNESKFKFKIIVFNDQEISEYNGYIAPGRTYIDHEDGTVTDELDISFDFSGELDSLGENSYFDSVFIPAKEIMSIYNDIINIRERLEMKGFDDTYYDTCKILARSLVKDRTPPVLKDVFELLGKMYNGDITYVGNEFLYVTANKKGFSMNNTAEGIRKVGLLTQIISNAEIVPGNVLFIDEPENNLHPKALRQFMEALVKLSQAGVQIFMASHNYFVLKQLEIIARRDGIDIGCYSLLRNDAGDIYCESGNLRHSMPENDIVNEGAAMFEDGLRVQMKNFHEPA